MEQAGRQLEYTECTEIHLEIYFSISATLEVRCA